MKALAEKLRGWYQEISNLPNIILRTLNPAIFHNQMYLSKTKILPTTHIYSQRKHEQHQEMHTINFPCTSQ